MMHHGEGNASVRLAGTILGSKLDVLLDQLCC